MGTPSSQRKTVIAGAALSALLLLATAVRAQNVDPALGPQSLIDRPAPELLHVHRLPDGEPVRLADFRGHVVLVELFSLWCATCHQATTRIDRLQQRHRDSLRVIAITQDARAGAEQFLRQNPVELTVAWDEGQTRRRYGARMLPTFVLIDRSGFVRHVFVGADHETLVALADAVRAFVR